METALPDVEIRRLDRLYPDGKFNIAAEQKSLLRADVIVWQFPFSWYGLPGLMKKWLDEVFVHGFAHGSTAKLGGKKLILSFTTGAPEELYTVDSFFGHTIEEYLIPFETTAKLCNLELLEPVYTCGISYADRDADKLAQQKTLAREHASRLVDLLNSVVNCRWRGKRSKSSTKSGGNSVSGRNLPAACSDGDHGAKYAANERC